MSTMLMIALINLSCVCARVIRIPVLVLQWDSCGLAEGNIATRAIHLWEVSRAPNKLKKLFSSQIIQKRLKYYKDIKFITLEEIRSNWQECKGFNNHKWQTWRKCSNLVNHFYPSCNHCLSFCKGALRVLMQNISCLTMKYLKQIRTPIIRAFATQILK